MNPAADEQRKWEMDAGLLAKGGSGAEGGRGRALFLNGWML